MSNWQCKVDGKELGPLAFAELAEMVREGKVTEGALVCRAGTMNWEPAWHVPGLFRAAGIVEPGDSPAVEANQADATQRATALTPALSQREQGAHTLASATIGTATLVRGLIAAAVGVLAVGFFYRWAYQTTLAFPLPPSEVEGEIVNCYFPMIGRCTMLECGLLYLDVFVVGAVATWQAMAKK